MTLKWRTMILHYYLLVVEPRQNSVTWAGPSRLYYLLMYKYLYINRRDVNKWQISLTCARVRLTRCTETQHKAEVLNKRVSCSAQACDWFRSQFSILVQTTRSYNGPWSETIIVLLSIDVHFNVLIVRGSRAITEILHLLEQNVLIAQTIQLCSPFCGRDN